MPEVGIEPTLTAYETALENHSTPRHFKTINVAAPRIARGSRGYGPRKILLLHAAIVFYYIFQRKASGFKKTRR